MSTDPPDIIQSKDDDDSSSAKDAASKRRDRLNNAVALTIAILATFMGICKVKDDNIVQAMQQAQVDRNDNWAWYQARHIRKDVLEVAADEMKSLHASRTANHEASDLGVLVEKFTKLAVEQDKKMVDLKKVAEGNAKTYDDLNYHDDQFDLMEAGLSIAIAMLAITSLTQSLTLYIVAMFPAVFGLIMGCAGLFGLNIHPDFLAKLLGT